MTARAHRLRASTLHRLAYRKGYAADRNAVTDTWHFVDQEGAVLELSSREAKVFLEAKPDAERTPDRLAARTPQIGISTQGG